MEKYETRDQAFWGLKFNVGFDDPRFDNFRSDKEIIFKSLQSNPGTVAYVSEELKFDREFMVEIAEKNRFAIPYMEDTIRDNKDFALRVIQIDGSVINHLCERFFDDKEVALPAVKDKGVCLLYLSDRLKNDPEIVLEAIKDNIHYYEYAGEDVKKAIGDKDPLSSLQTIVAIEKIGRAMAHIQPKHTMTQEI